MESFTFDSPRPDLGRPPFLISTGAAFLLIPSFPPARRWSFQPSPEGPAGPRRSPGNPGEQPVIQHPPGSPTLAGEAPVADASVEMEMVWRRPIMAR